MSNTIFMGTTKIAPEKTAMEIQRELQMAKVQEISSEYAPSGEIIALRFCQRTPTGEACWYRLPIRWEACKSAMRKMGKQPDDAQAKRVAWRQVLRWVQAQLALIEMNQTTTFEVFLPYMHVPGEANQTVGELFANKTGMKLLPPGAV